MKRLLPRLGWMLLGAVVATAMWAALLGFVLPVHATR